MKKDILDEDLVDEKVAAGVVASMFFLISLLAGAKLRAALFSLLAPVAIVYALPHVWRYAVRRVKSRRSLHSPADQLRSDRAPLDETVSGRAE